MASSISIGGKHARSQVEAQLTKSQRDIGGGIFNTALLIGLAIAIISLVAVLWTVLADGTGLLAERGTDFLGSTQRTRASEFGIFDGLRGTFWIGMFVVVFAYPLGIGAAIYLEEYATDNRLTRLIELNIRNLAGVPSVVYGVLGFSIYVSLFGGFFPGDRFGGETTAAAGATLATLVLPIVIITSQEAVRAVPQGLREAGYGVGATKWEVTRHHVLPYAAPGILTGTLLSLARALGEAAPLIIIGGVFGGSIGPRSGFLNLSQLGEEFTAMPLLITQLAKQPASVSTWTETTAAAILVLLAIVILANMLAILLRNRFETKRG